MQFLPIHVSKVLVHTHTQIFTHASFQKLTSDLFGSRSFHARKRTAPTFLHLVNWKTVCSPIPRGGLGMKNLMFNKALLGKWLWRDRNEQNSLWRQVIVMKYRFQRGGWCLEEARDPYWVSLWTNIRKDWGSFFNFVSYKNGEHLRLARHLLRRRGSKVLFFRFLFDSP